jgi:16S rRNA (uracil1498-N3)-methyltransferase
MRSDPLIVNAVHGVAGSRIRLYTATALFSGQSLDLEGKPAHYLRHVLRLSVGDALLVFNAADGEWLARMQRLGRSDCSLSVIEQNRPATREVGPWLAFASVRRAAVDLIVQKATELGAERLLPVITRRTVVHGLSPVKLTVTAIEAAEQCGRLSIPVIDEPVSLAMLVEQWPNDRRLIVLDPLAHDAPLHRVLPARELSQYPAAVGFLIGPEGGWASEEIEALCAWPGVRRASLGPRVLRCETAAIAVLAYHQLCSG